MKNLELKINAAFAILFAIMALTCLIGAALWGAWWHLYTFIMCVGLTWTMLTARTDDGNNVYTTIKKIWL